MSKANPSISTGILGKIRAVRRRRLLLEFGALLLLAAALALGMVALAAGLDWQFAWSRPATRWLPLAAVSAAVACAVVLRLARTRLHLPIEDEALAIDRALPELQERWSTTSELAASRREAAVLGSPALIAQVAAEARAFAPHVQPARVVSALKLLRPALAVLAGTAVFTAAALYHSGNFPMLLARFIQPWKAIPLTRIEVEAPARAARHSAVELRAEIAGRLPGSATLALRDAAGAERTVSLTTEREGRRASLRHRIADVEGSFAFQFRAGDAATPWRNVQAVDRPAIARLAFRIVPPAYTRRPASDWDALPKTASALRGSRVELEFTADQPLAQAALEIAHHPEPRRVALQPTGTSYRFSGTLDEAMHFSVLLENDFGLRNRPLECRIAVEDDRPPGVRILDTSETIALRANEAVRVDFEAQDDFGVARAELVATIRKPGEAPRTVVVPIDLGAEAGQPLVKGSAQLDLRSLPLDARSQVSYAVRVRDTRGAAASSRPADPQGGPDLPGESCSASQALRIEEFSPKADAVAEEKKGIAVGAALAAIRETAARTLALVDKARDGLRKFTTLDSIRGLHAQEALESFAPLWQQVNALQAESADTPYALFGVQTEAIARDALIPAVRSLFAAIKAPPPKARLDDSAVHLRRMIATLDALTQKHASMMEVKKAEDLLRQIKEMHMAFVADMPKRLKAGGKPPYEQSPFEVDAAYAKAYEEMLRQRAQIMKQLAELLARHPELAARCASQSAVADKFFREELLRLRGEQEEVRSITAATAPASPARATLETLWQKRLRDARARLAAGTSDAAAAATTWLPANAEPRQREAIGNAASQAALAAAALSDEEHPGPRRFEQALAALDRLQGAVADLERSFAYSRNRREDLAKLRAALVENRAYSFLIGRARFADAVLSAQRRLSAETGTLAALILQDTAGLATVSAEAGAAARQLRECFVESVAKPQRDAETALQAAAYEPARAAQDTAAAGLARAVKMLDACAQEAIRKMNEAKPGGGPPPPGSLEDLLRTLAEEKRSMLSLGLNCRKPNIQVPDSGPSPPPGNPGGAGSLEPGGQASADARAQAAAASAREAARLAAAAQQRANERARQIAAEIPNTTLSDTAPGSGKGGRDAQADWNTLPSELRATLLQEAGRVPPKRYQEAIEQYFKIIGGETKPAP